ncbi:hypothetical protein [Natrinema halophilum]|uniref:DUF8173 domain-containing protein n=1 Tax=Natrinema halophilum TaxID=1699371 RepID=A0A7D5H0C7_9EURY|nr:hypothetical protein [Natrinema halophilum]QLG47411.1 hypothetical protein HYG82_00400 [Natrinema halophilum]
MIGFDHWAATVSHFAQTGPGVNVDIGTTNGIFGGAVSAFLTTLVVGAIMVAVVPAYTERMMTVVLDDPIGSFAYGILSLLAIGFVAVVLILTVIGILVAAPLLILAFLVWAIGAAIAYLAIADRLVGREDGWLKPLVVAAAINGILVVTAVGGLLSICIGAAGFGAVLRNYLE